MRHKTVMNKVERANKRLDRIAQATGLSEDGKKWLIEVLDPFHDQKLDPVGYPDRETAPSIVQVVKQQASITIPTPSTWTGKKWGMHVMLDDGAMPSGQNNYSMRSGVNEIEEVDSVTKLLPYGGLNVVAFLNDSTDPTWQINTAATVPNVLVETLALDPDYLRGKARILSQGFEVCNTTPLLTLGGSVLVYEAPDSKNEQSTFNTRFLHDFSEEKYAQQYGDTNVWVEPEQWVEEVEEPQVEPIYAPHTLASERAPHKGPVAPTRKLVPRKLYTMVKGKKEYLPMAVLATYGARSYSIKNTPPNTNAEAMLLPGTQSWDAKEGCMVVQTMGDMNNPASFIDTRGSIFIPDEDVCPTDYNESNALQQIYTDPPVYFAPTAVGLDNLNIASFKTAKTIPFHRKGAIFTELSPESSFKINYTVIVERLVSQQDRNLVVLAKPSPGEDAMATQLYTHIIRDMPVGVRFRDNGFGDWFLGVVDEVANVVSSIGKPIMAAVNGYQQSRAGSTPQPTVVIEEVQAPLPKKTQKALGAGKSKKKGTVAGPLLPNNRFKSQQAKSIKASSKQRQGKAFKAKNL
jgi:hypothetical protein